MAAGVAAVVRRNRQIIIVVYMTEGARHVRMTVGQQKSGRAVVKFCVQPGVKRMAAGAVRSSKFRSSRLVLRVCGSQPIGHVAGGTLRRKPDVISNCGIRVAGVALHNCVRTEQWKPVEVVLNRLRGNLPAKRGVALRAILSHLRAMNVRVAIRAIFSHVGEYRFRVAAGARNLRVHSAERIFGRIVIKFGDGANRRPAGIGVAIFAGDIQCSVRTPFRLLLRRDKSGTEEEQQREHEVTTNMKSSVNNCPQKPYLRLANQTAEKLVQG